MIIVGIDSASKSGWAVLDGDQVVEHGVFGARSELKIDAQKIDAFSAYLVGKFKPDLVAVEDCYVDKNVHTALFLARLAGHWQQAFGARAVATELVMADAWQIGILTGLISRRSTRTERKIAAAAWVSATFLGLRVGPDVADAIGLATFVARREALAARVATARARAVGPQLA